MPDESQSSSSNLNSNSSGQAVGQTNQSQASSYQKNDSSYGQQPFVKRDSSDTPKTFSSDSRPESSSNQPKFKKGFIPLGEQKPFYDATKTSDNQVFNQPKTDLVQDEKPGVNQSPFSANLNNDSFGDKQPDDLVTKTAFSDNNDFKKPTTIGLETDENKESQPEVANDWQAPPVDEVVNQMEAKPEDNQPIVEAGPAINTGSLADQEMPGKTEKNDQTLLEQAQTITGNSTRSSAGFKKILIFLLVLLILFGLGWTVFKFVLPRFQKQKEVTLTYWGLWEPETVMKGIIADWEKANPNVKINYLQQSPKEYRERLQSALARNEGPDIFRYHLTWLPMLKNELEPLPAEVMSTAEYESAFYTVAKENLRSGTSYVGVPLGIDTLALFYNQEIFQAAGKTPPASWDELRQTAIDLTTRDESGRIQTAGVALGTTANIDHWSDILGLMMLQNGVNLANPTGSLAQDALTYYTIFNTTDRVWDETLPNSTLAFASGKVAMYFGYSWDILEIKKINPNLEFKVIPVPQLPDTQINWASFWVEGVSQKSENSKQAWEFLSYLSSKEVLQKIYQAESQTRLFGEIYPRADMANLLSDNPLLIPFVNQVVQAKTWYLCSRTFDNGINDRMIKYFEDAVNAVNSGKSSTDVLDTTAQGVSQLLSQYGLGSYIVR